MKLNLCISLALWAWPVLALNCHDLVLEEIILSAPNSIQDTEHLLYRGVNKHGKQVTLNAREFKKEALGLSLYLVGEKTLEEMKENLFYSPITGKIDIEEPLVRMSDEGDEVRRALYFAIKQNLGLVRYGEKSARQIRTEIETEKELVFVTHQYAELQKPTLEKLKSDPKLSALTAVWLVGIDSSGPVQKSVHAGVNLTLFSEGGDFDLKPKQVQTAYLMGGELHLCLSQTIATLATQSAQPHLNLRLVENLIYLNELHDVLTREKFEHPDFQAELQEEISGILGDKWEEISSDDTPFTWKHTKTGRTISLDLID